LVAVLLCAALAVAGGCGDDGGGKAALKVSAASSLKRAFEDYAGSFDGAKVSYSFAGSDELAAQIRNGAKPDVFAAANTKLPDGLHAAGMLEKPVRFTTNRLVIAVPADAPEKVRSLRDLAQSGIRIAAGSPGVPVGSYARKVLSGLPPGEEHAILANIRSDEPDVAGVVGKVAQGAVDAGFVYATDVQGAGGRLRAVDIPAGLQPTAVYGAAVVKGTSHRRQASEFVHGLTSGSGADALRAAGFGPPPS